MRAVRLGGLVAAWWCAAPAWALMTYSGQLVLNGAPANGSTSIQLVFSDNFDPDVGMSCTEDDGTSSTLVTNGFFQIPLDECETQITAYPEIWVHLTVEGNALNPVQVGAVPFASSVVGGSVDATTGVFSGNVGVGDVPAAPQVNHRSLTVGTAATENSAVESALLLNAATFGDSGNFYVGTVKLDTNGYSARLQANSGLFGEGPGGALLSINATAGAVQVGAAPSGPQVSQLHVGTHSTSFGPEALTLQTGAPETRLRFTGPDTQGTVLERATITATTESLMLNTVADANGTEVGLTLNGRDTTNNLHSLVLTSSTTKVDVNLVVTSNGSELAMGNLEAQSTGVVSLIGITSVVARTADETKPLLSVTTSDVLLSGGPTAGAPFVSVSALSARIGGTVDLDVGGRVWQYFATAAGANQTCDAACTAGTSRGTCAAAIDSSQNPLSCSNGSAPTKECLCLGIR
ncbi:MAG: hypothetical protein AB2A00_16365 [Myxococcota bacterium]